MKFCARRWVGHVSGGKRTRGADFAGVDAARFGVPNLSPSPPSPPILAPVAPPPSCPPRLPSTQLTISITFDNFPSETSWKLRLESSLTIIAQRGPCTASIVPPTIPQSTSSIVDMYSRYLTAMATAYAAHWEKGLKNFCLPTGMSWPKAALSPQASEPASLCPLAPAVIAAAAAIAC
eukprot:6172989-Pleurochrysis_carterae.AAC.1